MHLTDDDLERMTLREYCKLLERHSDHIARLEYGSAQITYALLRLFGRQDRNHTIEDFMPSRQHRQHPGLPFHANETPEQTKARLNAGFLQFRGRKRRKQNERRK